MNKLTQQGDTARSIIPEPLRLRSALCRSRGGNKVRSCLSRIINVARDYAAKRYLSSSFLRSFSFLFFSLLFLFKARASPYTEKFDSRRFISSQNRINSKHALARVDSSIRYRNGYPRLLKCSFYARPST